MDTSSESTREISVPDDVLDGQTTQKSLTSELLLPEEPKKEQKELTQFVEKHTENRPLKNEHIEPVGDVYAWLAKIGWSANPFTFTISPTLFVGYKYQVEKLVLNLQEKHKVILITGPTGSGKTTTLKWVLENALPGFDYVYIGKPPKQPDDFVDVFNEKFKTPWILRWFIPHIKNIYEVPGFLNKKTQKKHLVVLYDEAHESDLDVLEWLRVLCDQITNMTIIIAGLPVLETETLSKLETLRKRIMAKIELLSLTKEETRELIRKRIIDVGGHGDEFTDDTIAVIFQRTGGFPREIIRMANDFVNQAIRHGRTTITPDLLVERVEDVPQRTDAPSLQILETLSPMQREVLDMLMRPMTPGQIANVLDLTKYKSRQHAVRSMNNILKGLMQMGLVERQKRDRAFLYQLKGHVKNLLIKA